MPRPPIDNSPEARERINEGRKASRARVAEDANASMDALVRDQSPGFTIPDRALRMINRARTGHVPSLIGVKCWDCSGWMQSEIRDCSLTACPLHAVRPYR